MKPDEWSTLKVSVVSGIVVAVILAGLGTIWKIVTNSDSTPHPTSAATGPAMPSGGGGTTGESAQAPTSTSRTSSPTNEEPPSSTTSSTSPVKSTSTNIGPPAYEWVNLTEVPAAYEVKLNRPGNCTGGCTGFGPDQVRINGTPLANSWPMEVGSSGSSVTKWTLARSCTKLTMTVGLDDDRSGDGTVRFAYQTMGRQATSLASLSKGQSKAVRLNVTNFYDISLIATLDNSQGDGDLVADFGNISVYCKVGSMRTGD